MDVASGRRWRFRSWHALTSIGSAASSVLRHRRCHIVTVTVPAPSTAPSPSPASPAGRAAAAAAAAAADDDDDDAAAENIPVTNRSFWSRKIHLLCSGPEPGGGVDEALRLLDRLRLRGYRPDSLNLSSVVHGLCAAGRYLEAHRRLLLSVVSGWVPDDRTANVLVARLLDARSPDATRLVVDCLVAAKPAFVPSSASYNRLIDQFCWQSRLADARGVFLDMKARGHRPDVVSYTALIGGFGRTGQLDHAQQLFDEMTLAGVPPNSLTYSVLIRGVLRARRIERAREMVGELWTRMELEEDPRTNNAAFANLVDALSREGYFNEVFRLAEEMPQGKLCVGEDFAYGQMIDSLCRVGRHHGASRVVYIMRKRGFTPSLVSYNCIVHGLSKQGEGGCMRAYQLLREGVEMEYSPPESTYKSLVEGLCRAGDVPKAREVTELIMLRQEGAADRTRIYNMFLNALRLAGGDPGEQLNVLVSMLQNRCHPDVVTLNTVIHGFCKFGRIDEALKILNDMLGGSFCAPDAVTFTTILQGLLDAGRTAEALDVLRRKMPACSSCGRGRPPSTRTYNVVLRGLCKLGSTNEAMEVFHEMVQLQGVGADSTTHAIVMGGLLGAGRMDEAKSFWEDVVWPSHVHDDFVYAATLKGLCGLGKLDEACAFLYELVDCGAAPGVVCYNILIDGACKLGSKRRAYQVVSEMRKNGVTPDAVTWRILERLHKNYGGKEREPSLPVSRSEGFLQEESVPVGSSPIETRAAAGSPEEEDCEVETEVEGTATGGVVEKNYILEMGVDEEIRNLDDGDDADEMRRRFPAGDVCKVGSLLPSELTREPLSRVARRAFGLCV